MDSTSPTIDKTVKFETTKKRFFLDEIEHGGGSDKIAPGEKRTYCMRTYSPFRPEVLELYTFSVDGERHADCPALVREIRIADEVITMQHRGPRIVLAWPEEREAKGLRALDVAEPIFCVIENTSSFPIVCKAVYHGVAIDKIDMPPRSAVMSTSSLGSEAAQNRFVIPAGKTRLVNWRSLWTFRATKIWIHSDSRGDLYVEDIKGGNRSQIDTPLPVEVFARGLDVSMATLAVAQDFMVNLSNTGTEDRTVQIEVEGFKIDNPVFEHASDSIARQMAVGFYTKEIAPGQTHAIEARTEVDFTGERLVIPANPESFMVRDLQVNGKSQFVEATHLPAMAFAETAVGVRLSLDEAKIGMTLKLVVQNITDKPQTFRAVLFGNGKMREYAHDAMETPAPAWAVERALAQVQKMPVFQMLVRQAVACGEHAG